MSSHPSALKSGALHSTRLASGLPQQLQCQGYLLHDFNASDWVVVGGTGWALKLVIIQEMLTVLVGSPVTVGTTSAKGKGFEVGGESMGIHRTLAGLIHQNSLPLFFFSTGQLSPWGHLQNHQPGFSSVCTMCR